MTIGSPLGLVAESSTAMSDALYAGFSPVASVLTDEGPLDVLVVAQALSASAATLATASPRRFGLRMRILLLAVCPRSLFIA